MTDLWKLTIPCSREDAVRFEASDEMLEGTTLTVSQIDDRDDEHWQLEGYFEVRPDGAAIEAVLAYVTDVAAADAKIDRVEQQDWVTLSQQSLPPIHVGRFYVHTESFAHTVPPGSFALRIEAGQAFGTGSHYTTHGCLWTLDQLAKSKNFANILDLGTGSGILAFAAQKLWPTACVSASDIDTVAVDVARGNARVNQLAVGQRRGALYLVAAPGMAHRLLDRRGPYDLLIANILAGPLVDMADAIAAGVARGGSLVLAGLLQHQATTVSRAYEARGFRRVSSHREGDWPTLCLRKI